MVMQKIIIVLEYGIVRFLVTFFGKARLMKVQLKIVSDNTVCRIVL